MNKIIFFFLVCSLIIGQNQKTQDVLNQIQNRAKLINEKKDPQIENKFSQAKTLERAGLYEEAILLYKEINKSNPGEIKYFHPLKNYLKQNDSWDSLIVYTNLFCQSRDYDFQSKLELLDIYVLMDNDNEWQPLAKDLILKSNIDDRSIKKVLQKLINEGEFDFTYSLLKTYRQRNHIKDFYSLELASYLGMRMSFDKSINEYLLFLEIHPQQVQMISDRIMAFPDDPSINASIKSILTNSPIITSKFILADLQFKLKEYNAAYETLIKNDATISMLLEFGKDLIDVNEFSQAEKVFSKILKSTKNEQILNQTVFEIAKLCESQMKFKSTSLPFSGFYPLNSFFTSPFIALREESGASLQQAMEIYDSLRVTKKNAHAAYRLAEVQFRVLGDLDEALYLYKEAYKHGNSKELRLVAGLGIVNIAIAKGNLNEADKQCNRLINEHPDILLYQIKSVQILFYNGNFSETDTRLREILAILPLDDIVANDILDIISVLIPFKDNEDEFISFTKAQLNIQQNKRIDAKEKLVSLFDSNKIYIADMCRYQHAWLTYLQGEIQATKTQLIKINNDTIFKELSHIFYSEILDYIEGNVLEAIDSYLEFLELYPQSIYYDDVRMRIRELAS